MTADDVRKVLSPRIKAHRKDSDDAMPGWGLHDAVFANELCTIYRKLTGEHFDAEAEKDGC